ncbi:MAG: FCD domain-containing protein, partial [Acidimicrobiales bacterium]
LNSTYKGPEREIDIERSHAGHVAIYEHLARRDADAASDAMYDHIMTSWLERKQTPPRTVDDTSELGFSTPKA